MPTNPTFLEKTLAQFREQFANPNQFDSSSQFNPDVRGKLYPMFEDFLTKTIQDLVVEVREKVIGIDDKIKPVDLVDLVGLQKKTCNRLRKSQRQKLSELVG